MASEREGLWIPETTQATIKDLAERCEFFAQRARNGGTWTELQTWLLSMQPSVDLLVEMHHAVPRSARMPIPEHTIHQTIEAFVVPDTIEEGTP